MAARPRQHAPTSNWLAVLAGLVFVAGAGLVLARYLDEAFAEVTEQQEPEIAMPLSPIVQDGPPRPAPLSREEENWTAVRLGSFSLQVPGTPREDPRTGWFDHYDQVTPVARYSLPVTHRQSHVRVSAIRYGKGSISLQAASLAARHGIEKEFPGVTTVLPFDFRDLEARQLVSRPVNVDEPLRQHSYLIIHGPEMLVLCVKGHDTHPNRLAHQILRTVRID